MSVRTVRFGIVREVRAGDCADQRFGPGEPRQPLGRHQDQRAFQRRQSGPDAAAPARGEHAEVEGLADDVAAAVVECEQEPATQSCEVRVGAEGGVEGPRDVTHVAVSGVVQARERRRDDVADELVRQ